MTSTRDTAAGLRLPAGYLGLAELELRKLEDVHSGTTLPLPYVTARGLAAIAYAVLALRETGEDQGTDLSNAIAGISDFAGRITYAAEETADYTGRLAYAAGALPRWRRLFSRLRPGRRDSASEGPEEP